MRFWDEMLTKYGFGDGDSIPDGIGLYRDVYLKVVNKLAELKGSGHRYVPYDRNGVHNFYLICLVPAEWFDTVYLPQQTDSHVWQSADDSLGKVEIPDNEQDAQMREAISDAVDLQLDQYLDVTVMVLPEFEDFLAGLMLTKNQA